MVNPLTKQDKQKKVKKPFHRPQSQRFLRLGKRKPAKYAVWRRIRGIDSRFRRGFRGTAPHVRIGYGTKKEHKHLLPNGFLKFTVKNVGDLELLLMHNRKYAAEIAGNVSIRKRKEILDRAEALNVKVTNAQGKMRTEESA